VLVDLTMPGMNGLETLAAIRAVLPDIPALLVSGYHESDLPPEPPGRVRAFLPKPYTRTELVDCVACLLAGESPVPSR
jgi:DNA-binding NarL/FixJ family response regulator